MLLTYEKTIDMHYARFNETPENIEKLKLIATLSNTLSDYVYLREDSEGRYIEYAFLEGAPINNRCLSWYEKLHPKALIRNGHKLDKWVIKPIDKLYKLSKFNCNSSDCDVAKPNPKCVYNGLAGSWTVEEPVKCACWSLDTIYNKINMDFTFE